VKLPATYNGTVWVTRYVCSTCAAQSQHVELSPVEDEPHGLPFVMRWCECGGFLFARSADYDSSRG
jgi:hypothetical protein